MHNNARQKNTAQVFSCFCTGKGRGSVPFPSKTHLPTWQAGTCPQPMGEQTEERRGKAWQKKGKENRGKVQGMEDPRETQ